MIAAARLCGMSKPRAELYGKPHVGCHYVGPSPKSYERTQGWCAICGRPAACCHHVAPLGRGREFVLSTDMGAWRLRSALFCLCGSGTTGCHDGFHGGARYFPRWEWDGPDEEAAWWDGTLLARHAPHDPALYAYGRWEIDDRRAGRTITIREEQQ